MTTRVFDIEIYRNYLLVSFMDTDSGAVEHFEAFDKDPIDTKGLLKALGSSRLVSFNGINFDLPVLTSAIERGSIAEAKHTADQIIKHNMRYWQIGIEPLPCDHIDLIEVAPGIASLKLYGGRLHAKTLQDLPIEPDATISDHQRVLLRTYCENDLRLTSALFKKLLPQIVLRQEMGDQYGVDLRSKSDAQMAEVVIRHEVERLIGRKLQKADPFRLAGHEFKYQVPAFVHFDSQPLIDALAVVTDATFHIGANGVVTLPKSIGDLKIKIGGSVYRMGIGGLHSSEKSVAHFANDRFVLVDRDVASYYPSIILNCGLRPSSMGSAFTSVYRSIVKRRLKAKHDGDKVTADSLKITINGSFGKFGSPYSTLYSPSLLIQTTLTGQLALLMLIEMLENEGIHVVSANTDGIVIMCPRDRIEMMESVVLGWELVAGFYTEATEYQALYSRDVNNYVAIKAQGGLKVKGVYAPASLQKNPVNEIVATAAIKYLHEGTPIETTIHSCKDISRFVSVRTVRGGAVKDDTYLGRVVRWYYATGEPGFIQYKLNGYKVPRTEGAKPLMTLPDELPEDLDLDWYVREARSILSDLGDLT